MARGAAARHVRRVRPARAAIRHAPGGAAHEQRERCRWLSARPCAGRRASRHFSNGAAMRADAAAAAAAGRVRTAAHGEPGVGAYAAAAGRAWHGRRDGRDGCERHGRSARRRADAAHGRAAARWRERRWRAGRVWWGREWCRCRLPRRADARRDGARAPSADAAAMARLAADTDRWDAPRLTAARCQRGRRGAPGSAGRRRARTPRLGRQPLRHASKPPVARDGRSGWWQPTAARAIAASWRPILHGSATRARRARSP
mmetsp:Transcript_4921/g.15297  ORF Transcript_4921/g.15297 Transcript_4921/m.15297 type:complete len:259 (-) Transcript_4921:649-1425(-)